MNEIGLVLEGGGLHGIFTAGVLDILQWGNIDFPYCIGVSAGAAYGLSFASQQPGRNIEVNRKYISDTRYLSFRNLLRTGNIFDWNFVYKEIPLHLVPFDFKTFYAHGTRFRIGITNCETGAIEYRDGNALSQTDLMETLAASSSIPFVSRIAMINQIAYLDGGIADPIPMGQAFADGNKRLVMILTHHEGYRKIPLKNPWITRKYYKKYPLLVNALQNHHTLYNETLDMIEGMEQMGKVFVIRPSSPITISQVEKNPERLDALYYTACNETTAILPKLRRWLQDTSLTK